MLASRRASVAGHFCLHCSVSACITLLRPCGRAVGFVGAYNRWLNRCNCGCPRKPLRSVHRRFPSSGKVVEEGHRCTKYMIWSLQQHTEPVLQSAVEQLMALYPVRHANSSQAPATRCARAERHGFR